MYCPGVHANSVHACNAGNVKRLFESRAGLESVPCLAPWNIPWNIYSSAMAVDLCSTLCLWNIAYLLGLTAHDSYSHLFTEQTSGQVLHSLCRILPEAEVSHLHHAPSHGERCETSCFAIDPSVDCFS